MYDRLFTAAEKQAVEPAADAPALAAEIRALQVLIFRVLALRPDRAQPRTRRRGGAGRRWQRTVLLEQITAFGRACDVLQRLLKAQRALGPDLADELDQLFEEAEKYIKDPPSHEDIVIEEYVPPPHLTTPPSPHPASEPQGHQPYTPSPNVGEGAGG